MKARVPKWRLRLRDYPRLTLVLFPIVIVSFLVSTNPSTILTIAARSWEISDNVKPADAVVVLGGGDDRLYAAAELYRTGFVTRILLNDDDGRKLVLSLGIPEHVIEVFGSGLQNTYQEACALKAWSARTGIHHFIIPTEMFPSRRVQWIFTRMLKLVDAKIAINVTSIPRISANNWWWDGSSREWFFSEIVKYVYYRVRYLFDQC